MLIAALPTSSLGASRHPNPTFAFITTTANASGAVVVPLINSGQTFDGETFEGIPDGIGVVPVGNGQRYVDLYVNFGSRTCHPRASPTSRIHRSSAPGLT